MKCKCPKCGHEFEQRYKTYEFGITDVSYSDPGIIFQSSYLNPLDFYRDKYPNKEIPPYPYGICGDMMADIVECKVCGKLFWTADYSYYRSGLCRECSLKEVNK